MDAKYSIEEILSAVEDLNKINKGITKSISNSSQKIKVNDSGIPPSTLRLIKEAENS
tara:strand:- start:1015 stop:1185 length:171 start_codon:yes stop_codon:yes gene_type:complete